MPPTRECFEPEKPYEQGAGHYTGYKWAEEGHACSGLTASESFNESWEEYEADEDPMTGVPKMPFNPGLFVGFLLDHAFLVGLPIAVATRWYSEG